MLNRLFHRQMTDLASRDPLFIEAPAHKSYERFPQTKLPAPVLSTSPFAEVLAKRASVREFDESLSIPLSSLSDILFLGAGVHPNTSPAGSGMHKFHPSGGAKYPLEYYAAAYRVETLEPAVYHYDPIGHSLQRLINAQNVERVIESVATPLLSRPAVIIICTSLWGRNYGKYGENAYRLSLLEAGHSMQNILLASTALDLKSFPVHGIDHTKLSTALDVQDYDEDPLYIALIGA